MEPLAEAGGKGGHWIVVIGKEGASMEPLAEAGGKGISLGSDIVEDAASMEPLAEAGGKGVEVDSSQHVSRGFNGAAGRSRR